MIWSGVSPSLRFKSTDVDLRNTSAPFSIFSTSRRYTFPPHFHSAI